MSNGKNYIPRSIKLFDLYLGQGSAPCLILGVPTNAAQFSNWTAANLTAWQNFLAQWSPLFLSYSNRKGGYTTVIKTELEGYYCHGYSLYAQYE